MAGAVDMIAVVLLRRR